MATIINNPDSNGSSNNNFASIVVLILAIAAVVLFVIYGLPYIKNTASQKSNSINVPDKIDVNVNTPNNN